MLEALQRRHSDAKLGSSTQTLAPSNGAALAPPRSPELRRHSDVSPASLKELERVSELEKGTPFPFSHTLLLRLRVIAATERGSQHGAQPLQ